MRRAAGATVLAAMWAVAWGIPPGALAASPQVASATPGAEAADTATLSGVITGTRVLHADTVYRLQGQVAVGEEAAGWLGAAGELRVPAGTRVVGGAGSSLAVTAAGRLVATGTEADPVVFACADPDPWPGCWDGILVAGRAPVNDGTPAAWPDPPPPGQTHMDGELQGWMGKRFGGSDPTHDAGTLRYVVVSHAGGSGAALTLGAVGSGTELAFVQVHRSSAIGVQFIGGTASAAHLLSTGHGGDHVRSTNGHQGALQFLGVQMDVEVPEGPAGVRIRNTGDPATSASATPRTDVEIWNLTLVGGDEVKQLHSGVVFELHGRGRVENGLLTRLARGVVVDGTGTCAELGSEIVVDHTLLLDVQDPGDSGTCEAALESHLASRLVEGEEGDARSYAGELKEPFSRRLPDFGGSPTAAFAPATPPSPLDATGTFFGAFGSGGTGTPLAWNAGWTRGWEVSIPGADLPPAPEYAPPGPVEEVADPARPNVTVGREVMNVMFRADATEAGTRDFFDRYDAEILGGINPWGDQGIWFIRFPGPDRDFQGVLDLYQQLRQESVVEIVSIWSSTRLNYSSFPDDAEGHQRPNSSREADLPPPQTLGPVEPPVEQVAYPDYPDFPVAREILAVKFTPDVTEAEIRGFLQSYGAEIAGGFGDAYWLRFPDPDRDFLRVRKLALEIKARRSGIVEHVLTWTKNRVHYFPPGPAPEYEPPGPVEEIPDPDRPDVTVAREVMKVAFRADVTGAETRDFLNRYDAEILGGSNPTGDQGVWFIRFPGPSRDFHAVLGLYEQLRQEPVVESVTVWSSSTVNPVAFAYAAQALPRPASVSGTDLPPPQALGLVRAPVERVAHPDHPDFQVAREILAVKFVPTATEAQIRDFLQRHGAEIAGGSGEAYWLRFPDPDRDFQGVRDLAWEIRGDGIVEYVHSWSDNRVHHSPPGPAPEYAPPGQ